MRTSESIKEIAGALAKAQGAIKGATKDSRNPHFGNSYADLASVWEACRAQLAANGIAVIQGAEADGAKVAITTRLAHASGEWVESTLTVSADKATAQGVGSAITYGRRYGLASMVGVAPEDDDGEAAEGREKPKHDDAAAKVRQQLRSPAFRKQEAIRDLNALGLDVRGTLKDILGRTFPEGQDIKLQSEAELEKVEQRIVLLKAQHNGERASAHN